MGQTFSLGRSNKFTIFLSPIVDADSLCGPKLARLCLRYNVRRVDWYSIVNIEHGWVEVIRGITRNLLADVSDIRVVFSKARWRFLAGEEAFVAVREVETTDLRGLTSWLPYWTSIASFLFKPSSSILQRRCVIWEQKMSENEPGREKKRKFAFFR